MSSKLLAIAIAVMSVIYIFVIPHDPVGVKIAFKLVPMLLIILFACLQPPGLPKSYKTLVITGLFICMLADGLIYWFIIGLITFLIGHVIYIFAFRRIKKNNIPKWAAALLLVYGIIMVIWIAGTLWSEGEFVLVVAVILYIGVILTMGWNAFQTGNRYAIIGAILFIFSDSILAINKFIVTVPYEHALVMISYYGAQFLFAYSIFSHYSATRNNLLK